MYFISPKTYCIPGVSLEVVKGSWKSVTDGDDDGVPGSIAHEPSRYSNTGKAIKINSCSFNNIFENVNLTCKNIDKSENFFTYIIIAEGRKVSLNLTKAKHNFKFSSFH